MQWCWEIIATGVGSMVSEKESGEKSIRQIDANRVHKRIIAVLRMRKYTLVLSGCEAEVRQVPLDRPFK